MERDENRETLKSVYDLERLAGRIAFGNVNARDLIQLKQSLEKIPELKLGLKQLKHPLIQQLDDELIYTEDLVELLSSSLIDDTPVSIQDDSIIKDEYHEKLE